MLYLIEIYLYYTVLERFQKRTYLTLMVLYFKIYLYWLQKSSHIFINKYALTQEKVTIKLLVEY